MRRLALGCVVCVAFAFTGLGCKKKDDDKAKPNKTKPDTAKPDTAKPDTAKPDTAKPDTTKKPEATKPPANAIAIKSADGKTALALVKQDEGYALVDGSGKKVGRIKVQGDRIKVRDAGGTVSKAKRKGDGFKVYADDKVVLKVKKRGKDKYKLKTGDDADVGKVKNRTATLSKGETVKVEKVGETISVHRAGKVLFTVTNMDPEHAVFLGLTELTLHQRVAAALARARW